MYAIQARSVKKTEFKVMDLPHASGTDAETGLSGSLMEIYMNAPGCQVSRQEWTVQLLGWVSVYTHSLEVIAPEVSVLHLEFGEGLACLEGQMKHR